MTSPPPTPPNFAVVFPGHLYRSGSPVGLPGQARAAFATRLRLRTVVCLAAEEPELLWPYPVRLIRIDGAKHPSREAWREWRCILDTPQNFPMLVHCYAGAERTGAYVAYAMVYAGLPVGVALTATLRHGGDYWRLQELRLLEVALEALQQCLEAPMLLRR